MMTDSVDQLVIDTSAGTTTVYPGSPFPPAGTYRCIEGTAGASRGMNLCAGTAFGANGINESSVAYNVGGNAACEQRTVGGDDVAISAVFRGLRSWNGTGAPCGGTTDGDNTGRGALDWYQVIVDTTGGPPTPKNLILASWNNPGTVSMACINPSAPNAACGRAHWATFGTRPEAVPVPAAVWLLGSALGVLGWVRRRSQVPSTPGQIAS
jgi:hypothetical protein